MTQAVMKIVAINASNPAAIRFGVHPYAMFEPNTPMNVAVCNTFKGASYAV